MRRRCVPAVLQHAPTPSQRPLAPAPPPPAATADHARLPAAQTLEGAAWSPLLSAEERGKLVHGLVSRECVIFAAAGPSHPALVGPEGYLAWIAAWKASLPDASSSVTLVARSDPAVSSFITLQWTRGGTFAGPAPLFGVAPTGARLTVHGVTILELKGAQVVNVHVYVECSRHVAHAAVEQLGQAA